MSFNLPTIQREADAGNWRGKPIRSIARERARFWGNVRLADESGCWLWWGSVNAYGYGVFGVVVEPGLNWRPAKVRPNMAHRYAYEQLVGPIPNGLVLDHLCCVPLCVNPLHLEPVSNAENLARGGERTGRLTGVNVRNPHRQGYARRASDRQDFCREGHQFTEANTRYDGRGDRYCRACKVAADARYKRRLRERREAAKRTAGVTQVLPGSGVRRRLPRPPSAGRRGSNFKTT